MKYIISIFIIAGSMLFVSINVFAENSEMDLLVNMLVENGALTRDQANTLAQKAKEQAAKQTKHAEVATQKRWQVQQKKWEIPSYSIQTTWDNGLRFETTDGSFKTKVGGRVFADTVYVNGQSSVTERARPTGDFFRRNDQAYIRSARLNIEGTMFEDYFYKFAYEFRGDINTKTEVDGLRSMYLGMKNIPYVGKISIGHMKEPFSLEEMISRSYTTFLERSLPNAFAPGSSWGIKIKNDWFDKRMTFALGGFRNSDNSGTMASGNEWCMSTRLTALPWYGGKDKLVHAGASYSLRYPESGGWNNTNHQVRFRQRPELYTRDFIVDTGNFGIKSENRLGLEAAVLYGPLSLQGELIQTWVDNPNDWSNRRGHMYGGYGYLSYILTGEHRNYSKSSGEFKGVKPKNNFSITDKTWGAWEIAARGSYLNLNDKNVNIAGGEVCDFTLGVNWYLNPNMRLMANWVRSYLTGYGCIDGIQARAQVDF